MKSKAARTRTRTPKKAPQDWAPAFLEELARCGNVSATAVKVGRRTVYDRRSTDPVFAAAMKEALDVAVEFMEAEARRRAVDGTLRPVYQGGELVGHVREYSDVLLIFLLKAHRPEKYRDRAAVEHTGVVETHIYLPKKGSIPQ
jgi:hypothetical protein